MSPKVRSLGFTQASTLDEPDLSTHLTLKQIAEQIAGAALVPADKVFFCCPVT